MAENSRKIAILLLLFILIRTIGDVVLKDVAQLIVNDTYQ